jgi:chemotaxis-related protein WspB
VWRGSDWSPEVLFLLFQLGEDRYALNAGDIAEVLPLVALKQIPQAPRGIAGAFSYRGAAVPVVDLTELTLGRPSMRRLSTRLILLKSACVQAESHLLAVIAERATDTMRRNPMDFAPSGMTNEHAPYLGPVATDDRGIIQWIDPAVLLPPAILTMLFNTVVEG